MTSDLIEQRRRRLSSDYGIRHGVGVTLVGVAGLVDAILELYAAALLNNVRGLMRGCAADCDRVTEQRANAVRRGLLRRVNRRIRGFALYV
jgi:hypothetical protein